VTRRRRRKAVELFEHLTSFASLRASALRAVRGKRRKPGGLRRLPDDGVARFRNRLRGLRDRWRSGTVSEAEVRQRIQAWIAHASSADTVGLRKALFEGGWFEP
jgi:hypothetical protein